MGRRKLISGSILVEVAVAAAILASVTLFTMRTVASSVDINRSAALAALAEAYLDIRAGEIRRIPLSDLINATNPAIPTTPKSNFTGPFGTLYGSPVPVDFYSSEVRQVQDDANTHLRTHTIFLGVRYLLRGEPYVRTRLILRYESY